MTVRGKRAITVLGSGSPVALFTSDDLLLCGRWTCKSVCKTSGNCPGEPACREKKLQTSSSPIRSNGKVALGHRDVDAMMAEDGRK